VIIIYIYNVAHRNTVIMKQIKLFFKGKEDQQTLKFWFRSPWSQYVYI